MKALHFSVCLLCLFGYQEDHEPEQKQAIETLVDRILAAKQADPTAEKPRSDGVK